MEYLKKINLLDKKKNKPSKFRIKNWFEIDDDLHGMYSNGSLTKFKTIM